MVIPMTSLKLFSGLPESCPIFIPGLQVKEIGLGWPGPSRGPDWERDFAQAILQSNRQIKGLIFAKFHYRNALFDVTVFHHSLGQWALWTQMRTDPLEIWHKGLFI
jgi:hypothetical protein